MSLVLGPSMNLNLAQIQVGPFIQKEKIISWLIKLKQPFIKGTFLNKKTFQKGKLSILGNFLSTLCRTSSHEFWGYLE